MSFVHHIPYLLAQINLLASRRLCTWHHATVPLCDQWHSYRTTAVARWSVSAPKDLCVPVPLSMPTVAPQDFVSGSVLLFVTQSTDYGDTCIPKRFLKAWRHAMLCMWNVVWYVCGHVHDVKYEVCCSKLYGFFELLVGFIKIKISLVKRNELSTKTLT